MQIATSFFLNKCDYTVIWMQSLLSNFPKHCSGCLDLMKTGFTYPVTLHKTVLIQLTLDIGVVFDDTATGFIEKIGVKLR